MIGDTYPGLEYEYECSNPTPWTKLHSESAEVVAWRCPAPGRHSYRMSVIERTVCGVKCPVCASEAATKRPKLDFSLMAELHPTENDPFIIQLPIDPCSREVMRWRCRVCQTAWNAAIADRVSRLASCPACKLNRRALKSDETHRFESEWHPTRNAATNFADGALQHPRTSGWWLCQVCATEFEASLSDRQKQMKQCPCCHPTGVADVKRADDAAAASSSS